jgi:hypothetical protein
LGLFSEPPSAVDQLRDVVAERFGRKALTRASLLRAPQGTRSRPHHDP